MYSSAKKAPPLPDNSMAVQEKLSIPTVSLQKLIDLIEKTCAPSQKIRFGSGKHTMIILPEAWDELKHMIYYGKRRATNRYEQHYEGIGHFLQDENGATIIVVTHFMYIYSGNRGSSHATVIKETDATMLDLLEQELAIYNDLESRFNKDENGYALDPLLTACGPSCVVVFGHTHPGIGVFFSQTDHGSHYASEKTPFASMVCDPIQKQLKCMIGIEHANGQILVFEALNAPAAEPGEETQAQNAERPLSKQEIAQEVARYANLLLAKNGVKGSFDSYRNWRGWMCMEFSMKYRTDPGWKKS